MLIEEKLIESRFIYPVRKSYLCKHCCPSHHKHQHMYAIIDVQQQNERSIGLVFERMQQTNASS